MKAHKGKMVRIFINYRKREDAYAAALLDQLLSLRLGENTVFRSARSIKAGENYAEAIRRGISDCSVMLVIIGENWKISSARGNEESERPFDWVRYEIATALASGKVIIPILLAGITDVKKSMVPAELEEVTMLQYLRFDYRNAQHESENIARQVKKVLPDLSIPFFRRKTIERIFPWK